MRLPPPRNYGFAPGKFHPPTSPASRAMRLHRQGMEGEQTLAHAAPDLLDPLPTQNPSGLLQFGLIASWGSFPFWPLYTVAEG
jgi:hypothetical protein